MGNRFDPGKESHYLQYLDANNLYGWAMVQKLPTGGFKWVENPDEFKGNISMLANKAGKGYFLEVDIFYPTICTIYTGDQIQSKCMVSTIHRVQHSTLNRAKNDFEKDFFELTNNSMFEKMMENIGKHRDINLVTNDEAYLKRVMKPNFKSGIIFSNGLMGYKMGKVRASPSGKPSSI